MQISSSDILRLKRGVAFLIGFGWTEETDLKHVQSNPASPRDATISHARSTVHDHIFHHICCTCLWHVCISAQPQGSLTPRDTSAETLVEASSTGHQGSEIILLSRSLVKFDSITFLRE